MAYRGRPLPLGPLTSSAFAFRHRPITTHRTTRVNIGVPSSPPPPGPVLLSLRPALVHGVGEAAQHARSLASAHGGTGKSTPSNVTLVSSPKMAPDQVSALRESLTVLFAQLTGHPAEAEEFRRLLTPPADLPARP